jgi:hypothetical protein
MENLALQRGPIAVLSTERFSSKLGRRTYPAAAAIFRVFCRAPAKSAVTGALPRVRPGPPSRPVPTRLASLHACICHPECPNGWRNGIPLQVKFVRLKWPETKKTGRASAARADAFRSATPVGCASRRDQQVAHQLSGNGISGQAI